jgi:hypothetical protein
LVLPNTPIVTDFVFQSWVVFLFLLILSYVPEYIIFIIKHEYDT